MEMAMKQLLLSASTILALGAFLGCQNINVDTETVDEPTFDLTQGPYNEAQIVRIGHSDPMAGIYYAVASGPTTSTARSSLDSAAFSPYTPGTPIACSDTVTLIKAYAAKPGLSPSASVQGRFAVVWHDVSPAGLIKRETPALTVVGSDICIAGGFESDYSAKVEYFTPSSNSLAVASDLNTPRNLACAATVSTDIYIIGGANSGGSLGTNEALVNRTPPWSAKLSLPSPRDQFGAASVSGLVYAIGGRPSCATVIDAYDPGTNTWSRDNEHGGTLKPMTTGRYQLALAVYGGKIYALGGYTGSACTAACEAYSPSTNEWISLRPLPSARMGLAACTVGDFIYAIGGKAEAASSEKADVDRYSPVSDTWTAMTPTPVIFKFVRGVALDGIIYIYGKTGTAVSDPCYIYAYNPGEDY